MRTMIVLAVLLGLAFGCLVFGQEPKDEELGLTLEKVTAPFDAKAKVFVEQKDGKFKEYKPSDHKKFDKEVDDLDLEITEIHIKDRKIIRLTFGKKLEKKPEAE